MGRMCLFSAVRGVVLDHGQPVPGARVERSWKWRWKGTAGGDSAISDVTGSFNFPAVWGTSLPGLLLPHEPFVEQTILVRAGGHTCTGWMLDKRNYDENGEIEGRPIVLTCHLETEAARKILRGHTDGLWRDGDASA